MITEKDIKNTLDTMSEVIRDEELQLFRAVAEHMPEFKIDDHETFHLKLVHTYGKFLRGLIRSVLSESADVEFLLIHGGYFQNQLRRYIEYMEGGPCSADKVSAITRKLLNHFASGTPIVYDWEAEYTYHYPKYCLQTQEEVLTFFREARNAYYGYEQGHQYLAELYRQGESYKTRKKREQS